MTDVTTPPPASRPGPRLGPPPGPPSDGWWSRPGGTTGESGTAGDDTTGRPPPFSGPTQPVPPYPAGDDGRDPWQLAAGQQPPRATHRQTGPRRRPGWVALVASTLAAGLLGGVIGSQASSEPAETSPESTATGASVIDPVQPAQRAPESIAGIADAAIPSVVSISTNAGSGSGFIITEDGFIVTNNHVIESAGGDGIQVALQDGRTADARLVGTSPAYDLAVLDVELAGLTPLPLGDSDDVAVGDTVVAVGSPLGLDGTVTSGIVSAMDRPVSARGQGEFAFINAIQTDAAINPGNSGGPLLDAAGRVIGVNSAIYTVSTGLGGSAGSIGLGFSIPINQARLTAEQIIATGEASYPVIGATVDMTPSMDGAVVDSVLDGGPADAAGLRPGDRIVAVDGQRVGGGDELIVAIRARQPGDTVELTIDRSGTEETVTATLDSRVG